MLVGYSGLIVGSDSERSVQGSVGVIGAASLVGGLLLPQLISEGYEVKALTRRDPAGELGAGVEWLQLSNSATSICSQDPDISISHWICLAPIWALPEYFPLLSTYGVRRIVALSSTSMFTKSDSSDSSEQETACMLAEGEEMLCAWAERNGVEWLILRPTLVYGLGRDKNISEIARFIRRFGFFPLAGKAQGLRQPVHAADVANACGVALLNSDIANRAYNITGGETLAYREMVARIFTALGRPVRALTVPLWVFRACILFLRQFPRYRHWTVSMAMRMSLDLVFDYGDAERDLSYTPRSFMLREEDVSVKREGQALN